MMFTKRKYLYSVLYTVHIRILPILSSFLFQFFALASLFFYVQLHIPFSFFFFLIYSVACSRFLSHLFLSTIFGVDLPIAEKWTYSRSGERLNVVHFLGYTVCRKQCFVPRETPVE